MSAWKLIEAEEAQPGDEWKTLRGWAVFRAHHGKVSSEDREFVRSKGCAVRRRMTPAEEHAEELLAALDWLHDLIDIPDSNCSCHLRGPCTDCVDNGAIREAYRSARDLLAKTEVRP